MERLSELVADRRVIPSLPPERTASVTIAELPGQVAARDHASAWTAFMHYVDSGGIETRRRFTCQSIHGFAGAQQINGYCHERAALRTLRIDRIRELVCAETGEVLDPAQHFEWLRETGALNVKDKALTELCRVMVFLAECDGDYHPLERDALHSGIERYALRFGATDRCVEEAIKGCRRLKPDGDDLVASIAKFAKAENGARLCRFVLDSGAAIIDADGRHSREETEWALEMSSALKAICDRR